MFTEATFDACLRLYNVIYNAEPWNSMLQIYKHDK